MPDTKPRTRDHADRLFNTGRLSPSEWRKATEGRDALPDARAVLRLTPAEASDSRFTAILDKHRGGLLDAVSAADEIAQLRESMRPMPSTVTRNAEVEEVPTWVLAARYSLPNPERERARADERAQQERDRELVHARLAIELQEATIVGRPRQEHLIRDRGDADKLYNDGVISGGLWRELQSAHWLPVRSPYSGMSRLDEESEFDDSDNFDGYDGDSEFDPDASTGADE